MSRLQHTFDFECPYCAGEVPICIEVHIGTNVIPKTPTFDSAPPSVLDIPSAGNVDVEKPRHEDTDSLPVDQACTNCHSRKKKCSPTLPCETCVRSGRGLECVYPPANERYKRKNFALGSRVSQGPPGPGEASVEMFRLPPSPRTASHRALVASATPDLGGPSTQGQLDVGGLTAAYVPHHPQLLFPPPQPSFPPPQPLFGSLEFGPATYPSFPPRRDTPTVYGFPFVENGEGVQVDGYPPRFDHFSRP